MYVLVYPEIHGDYHDYEVLVADTFQTQAQVEKKLSTLNKGDLTQCSLYQVRANIDVIGLMENYEDRAAKARADALAKLTLDERVILGLV